VTPPPFRRILAIAALFGGLMALVASCAIPTDDRPQPVTREQTTTIAPTP